MARIWGEGHLTRGPFFSPSLCFIFFPFNLSFIGPYFLPLSPDFPLLPFCSHRSAISPFADCRSKCQHSLHWTPCSFLLVHQSPSCDPVFSLGSTVYSTLFIFCPEDRGSRFHQNISNDLPYYTASHPRTQ
jgi:hypothetical protein